MQPYRASFTGKNVVFLPQTHSTNTDALELISKSNPPDGTCIKTDFQTAGKGQIGRTWNSESGKNLLMSFIFYPKQLQAIDQFYMNMAVSLALTGTLATLDIPVKIKWPNDIYWENKKMTGILIQNTIMGSTIKASIVGIGLNVNQMTFPSEIPNPISMAQITGQNYNLDDVFDLLCDHLEYYYMILNAKKHQHLSKLYHNHLYLLNQKAQYQEPNQAPYHGYIRGVDQLGKLMIENESGSIKSYMFKEVRYVLEH
ncbi:MAG: biotin--[acetyl-CoA-carboxylase] ligase [Chitinophagales bacterium]|nr:biotin--[acetyl-CoA-carboxylase] ligase [Chitinophagales bacterium]